MAQDFFIGQALGVPYFRTNASESYVTIPPALLITDSDGATWTFGFEYVEHHGEFHFNVLRNDVDTGELASRIEYRRGTPVRIFGQNGWKTFSRNRKTFI